MERLGVYVPHHVQAFFDRALTHCRVHHLVSVSAEDLDRIYRQDMLGPRGHAELSHYEERLRMVLGAEMGTLASALLTRAAKRGILSRAATRDLR